MLQGVYQIISEKYLYLNFLATTNQLTFKVNMGCTGKGIVYVEVECDQTIPEGWKSAECTDINFS